MKTKMQTGMAHAETRQINLLILFNTLQIIASQVKINDDGVNLWVSNNKLHFELIYWNDILKEIYRLTDSEQRHWWNNVEPRPTTPYFYHFNEGRCGIDTLSFEESCEIVE